MKKLSEKIKKIYYYIIAIPDKLYPFASIIEGKVVRGESSYLDAVKKAFELNGEGKFGMGLMFYRQTFHLIGAVLFVIFSTLISSNFFDNELMPFFLFGFVMVALAFQEFYFHPKKYNQVFKKGFIDWVVWIVPMAIYLIYFA
ncbi:hypothetical protein GW764_02305 [Candidatus Parcubacteria bacterium]|nr:hypothetical protein [Candidatus Parcubacteria bacterium]